MANHNLPTQTSGYVEFVQQLDNRFDDLARGLDPSKSPVGDPTISNLPVDSIGWSSENKHWRKWNGSGWESLVASNLYSISVTGNAGSVTDGVYVTGDQTIAGVKTFSSTIVGSITGSASTAATLIGVNWSITEVDGSLYFKYDNVNKMKLDIDGNLLVVGEVTAGAIIE